MNDSKFVYKNYTSVLFAFVYNWEQRKKNTTLRVKNNNYHAPPHKWLYLNKVHIWRQRNVLTDDMNLFGYLSISRETLMLIILKNRKLIFHNYKVYNFQ